MTLVRDSARPGDGLDPGRYDRCEPGLLLPGAHRSVVGALIGVLLEIVHELGLVGDDGRSIRPKEPKEPKTSEDQGVVAPTRDDREEGVIAL